MTKHYRKIRRSCLKLMIAALLVGTVGAVWIIIQALAYEPFSTLPIVLAFSGSAVGLAVMHVDDIIEKAGRR